MKIPLGRFNIAFGCNRLETAYWMATMKVAAILKRVNKWHLLDNTIPTIPFNIAVYCYIYLVMFTIINL